MNALRHPKVYVCRSSIMSEDELRMDIVLPSACSAAMIPLPLHITKPDFPMGNLSPHYHVAYGVMWICFHGVRMLKADIFPCIFFFFYFPVVSSSLQISDDMVW